MFQRSIIRATNNYSFFTSRRILHHLLIRIRRIQQLSAQLSVTVDDRRDVQRNAEHLLEEATILVESFYGEGVRRPAPLVRAKFGND
jgi:hypothetical protein